MASPTQWTWVWVDSGSWWWTGRPGVLWFMGSQRVGHDWVTELNRRFMNANNWTKIKYDVLSEISDSGVFHGLKISVSLMMTEWTMQRPVDRERTKLSQSLSYYLQISSCMSKKFNTQHFSKISYKVEKMPTNSHSSKWNSLNFLKPCLGFTELNQDPTWSIFPTKLEKHWSDPIPFSLFIPNCIVLVQSLILCSFIVSIASLLVFIPQILPISYNIHAVARSRFSSRSICSFHFHTIKKKTNNNAYLIFKLFRNYLTGLQT